MTDPQVPLQPHHRAPASAAVDAAVRAKLKGALAPYPTSHVGLSITAGHEGFGRRVFNRGGTVSRRAASLIKLPVMCTVFEAIREGRLDWEQPVAVTSTADGCGILQHVSAPDPLALRDAVMLMISLSDNRATNAVLEAVTRDAVNDWLHAHGYRITVMRHGMRGLAGQFAAGPTNRTSVSEITRLLTTCFQSAEAPLARLLLGAQQINDRLAPATPTGWRVCHKTGELDGLRHDAAWFERDDGTWASAVMMTDGFTDEDGALSIFGNARLYSEVAEILHAYLRDLPPADRVRAPEEGHE